MNLQTFFLLQRHYNNCWTQWFVWLIVYIMTLNPSIGSRNISMFREYLICSVTLLFEPFETTTKIKSMVISKILELKWKNGFLHLWSITYSLYLNWRWCDRFVPNQSQTRLVNKNLILAKHMLGCKRKTNMNQDTTVSLRFM